MSFAVVSVLFQREIRLFVTQRSRLVGALAQPLLFWLVLGTGLAPSFKAEGGAGYTQYFYSGILVMTLLFSSISVTMSVIEDRHRGFMQGVLAAPGSRASVAMGKVLGGAAVGFLQTLLLLALAPLAGYSLGAINWPATLLSMALASTGLTALGFVLAWRLDSSAGYHGVMSVLLLPLWVLSGALFPLEPTHAVMAWVGRLNPMTYAVSSLRGGLEGAPFTDLLLPLGVLLLAAGAACVAAARTARRGGI